MKNFDAASYVESKKSFNNDDENLLLGLLTGDKVSGAVLDIGCGDGKLAHKLQESLPSIKITGIDNSPEQIALAQRNQEGPSFVLADITNYQPDIVFDSAYSFYAFPHIPKSILGLALETVRKLVKQGGAFYLFTNICLFETSKATQEDQEACDINLFGNWPTQINLTSLEEMRSLVKEAGFSEIDNRQLITGAKIKDYGDMVSWMFVLK